MYYETNNSVLYGDTLVPDVFISEYLPALNGDFLKVYIYILFLINHSKHATPWDISKKINLDVEKVKEAIEFLESMGVLNTGGKKITMVDLKEKEIKKLFRPKTTSTPNEANANNEKNKRRNATIYAINESFFQGLMSPSWYTDIDTWFERYKFDEDVMYTLFNHCYENNGLFKNYIQKVAESWHMKNIKTAIDLDKYYLEFQKMRDVRGRIVKKLKLGRMITEYEEEFLEKWCGEYNYDFDIIEIALKKTTGRTSPSFNYIDTIISDWHKKGFKTKQEILEYMKNNKNKTIGKNESDYKGSKKVPQHSNFEQREYNDADFDKFYANLEDDEG